MECYVKKDKNGNYYIIKMFNPYRCYQAEWFDAKEIKSATLLEDGNISFGIVNDSPISVKADAQIVVNRKNFKSDDNLSYMLGLYHKSYGGQLDDQTVTFSSSCNKDSAYKVIIIKDNQYK